MDKSISSHGKLFNKNLSDFINQIDSLNQTLPFVMELIRMNNSVERNTLKKFIAEHTIKKEVTEVIDTPDSIGIKEEIISVTIEESLIFERLDKNVKVALHSEQLIPQSLFVTLISQFDAFLGGLIKIIFQIHPERLYESEKNIPYNKIVEFSDIDEIKTYLIEKEVESVLRENHADHFSWLEKKLTMTLKKDLKIWPFYIEITERRNLFVHNSGVVSNQYLNICRSHKCEISDLKIGDTLSVTDKYFSDSHKCLYELAVKLTQVIWRKLLPNELKFSDTTLNNICYDLIENGKYDLANIMLLFASDELKKHHDESFKNYFLINKALALYLSGDTTESLKALNSKDWSATSNNFKLAVATLKEEFEEANKIIKQIGKSGEVPQHAYQTWPLFREIRKHTEFQDTFKEIFDTEFKVIERPSPIVSKMIDVLQAKSKKNQPKEIEAKKTRISH